MVPSDVESQESSSQTVNLIAPDGKELTPIQSLSLWRLESLTGGAYEYALDPDHDAFLLEVLQKAAYSVYRDCLEIGLGEDAREILEKTRNPK